VKIKVTTTASDAPSPFVAQHASDVIGVLSGFDRLRLMATLRPLYQPSLMGRYLIRAGVLLKDFGAFAAGWTERVRGAARQLAEQTNRPLTYLHGSTQRKELLAQDQARRDGLTQGLIGIWSAVEPCLTYFVRRDRAQKKLVLRLAPGKCLHYYFYFLHEQLGLLHLRLQTWFPFALHLCLNGRHWLARQLDQAGIGYVQRENCFTWIEDQARAQALARAQLQSRWPTLLQPLVEQCHPHATALCRPLALSYYWSVSESEYATDVMFKSPTTLARLYPALVHQGIKHFGSTDVLRFLGHKVQANGRVHGNHQGEILSSLKHRPEGLRLKHQANGNSVKLYDKQGSVLRVETTLNRPHQFRVYRASERDPEQKKRWQVLRKSVGDLHRRAQICEAINGRYLEALASVRAGQSAGALARAVCRPIRKDGRRHRALNPWSPEDAALLELICRGEWTISGFRNRDVRMALYPGRIEAAELRRQSGRVTRALARLRAHGIIKKVTGSYRYQLTGQGRQIVTALLAARQADVEKLIALAT
jgi:DNA-binding MarR family transcriptional regulator